MLQATTAPDPQKQRDPLAMFLIVSFVLHLLLVLLFPVFQRRSFDDVTQERLTEVELLPESTPPPRTVAKATPPPTPPPVVQEKPKPQEQETPPPPVVQEKPKPQEQEKPPPPQPKAREQLPEQMVSPPEQVNDQVPEKTRLLSDRNSATKKETVAHGFPRPSSKETTLAKKTLEPPKEPVALAEKAIEKPPLVNKPKQPLPAQRAKITEKAQPLPRPERERLLAKQEPAPSTPPQAKSIQEESLEGQESQHPKPPGQLAMRPPETEAPTRPQRTIEKDIERLPESRTGDTAPAKRQIPGAPGATKRAPQLFVPPSELLAQGWIQEAEQNREKEKTRQPPSGSDIVAMAPSPAPNLFSMPGEIGTPDDLPDIQQGNLTFLNTKAHRFSPFVRRVALRVFQHLIILQRKNLNINDVVAAREMSTIEAKLDDKGTLKGLVIQTRSGSYAIDSALLKACESGAWDENPPPGAHAEDGMIHFVFRSNINAQYDDLGLRAVLTTLQVGLI
ncbi:MAG: hypothetical protein EXR78_07260 [Deltaproteobacteria bacterium]|nr:hypothetical protein [Deltaproteobacteria bacterium]